MVLSMLHAHSASHAMRARLNRNSGRLLATLCARRSASSAVWIAAVARLWELSLSRSMMVSKESASVFKVLNRLDSAQLPLQVAARRGDETCKDI